jgi:hypothetical protein
MKDIFTHFKSQSNLWKDSFHEKLHLLGTQEEYQLFSMGQIQYYFTNLNSF